MTDLELFNNWGIHVPAGDHPIEYTVLSKVVNPDYDASNYAITLMGTKRNHTELYKFFDGNFAPNRISTSYEEGPDNNHQVIDRIWLRYKDEAMIIEYTDKELKREWPDMANYALERYAELKMEDRIILPDGRGHNKIAPVFMSAMNNLLRHDQSVKMVMKDEWILDDGTTLLLKREKPYYNMIRSFSHAFSTIRDGWVEVYNEYIEANREDDYDEV